MPYRRHAWETQRILKMKDDDDEKQYSGLLEDDE